MMKNKYLLSIITINVSTLLTASFIGLAASFMRAPDVHILEPFFKVLLLSIGFCTFMSISGGILIRPYRYRYDDSAEDAIKFQKDLKRLGALPTKLMRLFLIVAFGAVTGVIALFGWWLGVNPGLYLHLCGLGNAIAMAGSMSFYIFSDKTNVDFIASQQIVHYPENLRIKRISNKFMILPLFAFGTGVIYTSTILLTINSGLLVPTDNVIIWGIIFFTVLSVLFFSLFKMNRASLKKAFEILIEQLDQLASTEKNLTKRVFASSVDELGTVTGLINNFTLGLEKSVKEIQKAQYRLGELGENLQKEAEGSAKAVEEIASGSENVTIGAQNQAGSVQEISTAVQQIASNISSLDSLIISQSSSITESSTSIEEMVGNISSINNSISIMAQQFSSLANIAKQGTVTQEASTKKIADIAERSESLLEANKVIATIAAQTNLLAMNAAIEAAHAGEAGKGFSVVADEIRKLAESASGNSKVISSELKEVQEGISSVVKASQQSKEDFDQVFQYIGTTETMVEEIKSTIDEQQEGAKQILEALVEMKDIASQVQSRSSEMNSGNSTILKGMSQLQNDTDKIAENMDSMAQNINGVNNGVRSVSQIADNTKQMIEQLANTTKSFKTGN